MSNMHQGSALQPNSSLPEIIHFYNQTKGGVDVFDQMCAHNSCSRKTKRWPLCLFYGMINSACLNAYIILRENTFRQGGRVPSRQDFLLSLGEELMRPWMERRIQVPNLPRSTRQELANQLGVPLQEAPQQQPTGSKGRCHLCPRAADSKTTVSCVECHKYVCGKHKFIICQQCK